MTTNGDVVDRAAREMFRRCAAGETLSYRLAQNVVEELGSTARPGAVMFVAAGMLSDHARWHRQTAESA